MLHLNLSSTHRYHGGQLTPRANQFALMQYNHGPSLARLCNKYHYWA